MAQVQCRLENPNTPSSESAELTVGSIFQFVCEGEWPALKSDALELRLEKEDQYKLKLMKFETASNNLGRLTVVSYKAGQHKLKSVQLVDPEHSVVLGDLEFTIASVINPQEPPAEPYGPFGPYQLSLPLIYPLSAVLLLSSILGFFFYRWKIKREKNRLLNEMRLTDSAQEPFFQFYGSLRKLQRSYSFFSGAQPTDAETRQFLQDLTSAYKIYLARHFLVPTLKWKDRQILADLKRNHRKFYTEFQSEVRKSLAECTRAQNPQQIVSGKDGQQLLELLRKNVDQIEAWLKGNSK